MIYNTEYDNVNFIEMNFKKLFAYIFSCCFTSKESKKEEEESLLEETKAKETKEEAKINTTEEANVDSTVQPLVYLVDEIRRVKGALKPVEQQILVGDPLPPPGNSLCQLVDEIRRVKGALKPVEQRILVGGDSRSQLMEKALNHPSVTVLQNVMPDWGWMRMTGMIKTKTK